MLQQISIPVGQLPISLVLLSDATIAFVRTANFAPIFDLPSKPENIAAKFYEEGFSLGEENLVYNVPYRYKEIPNMLGFLQQQELISPFKN